MVAWEVVVAMEAWVVDMVVWEDMVVATGVDTEAWVAMEVWVVMEVWVAMEVVMEVLEMDMECKTDAARRSLSTAMRIQK